ncbi:PAS domain S-box-containing protein [Archangium gephyra]|uniref:histidine kinase n=1 Tax=Archangium gephyra TaxID=48 RepID=A0AAC8TJL4_9BACT|nr:ATP-binding protein [Archangium gephyra]AKJ08010.1 Sensory box histidine kinase [Archangium gephyra]REG29754.1 PAS domain S-box-containing protein [Archangium gephyra]
MPLHPSDTLARPLRSTPGEKPTEGSFPCPLPPPSPPGSDASFRLLVESVEDVGLYMLEPDGRVASWNVGAERMTGYRAAEVLGRHCSLFFLEEDVAAGLPQRLLDEAEQLGKVRDEGWRLRRDGTRFYALILITAIRDAEGRLRGFTGLGRDITARRETELQLREARDALRRHESLSDMGSLVAGVAHEVRNPLFGISATLDAFEARFGHSPEHAPFLSTLRREVSRLHHLMHELLTYGRPPGTELHPCSLSSVFAESMDVTAALAREREVHVELSVEPALPRVPMDPGRLVQVFQNLLANALQHSPSGSTVRLTARRLVDEGHTRVECMVMDQGPGFVPEHLPRVFEPFYSQRPGGVGLGLPIVQRIVQEHHGSVSVGNGAEGGAEVRVYLPAEGEPSAATHPGSR